MFRRGVLILGAGRNAIRFAPPLVLTKDAGRRVLRVFDEALTEVGGGAQSCDARRGHDAPATAPR